MWRNTKHTSKKKIHLLLHPFYTHIYYALVQYCELIFILIKKKWRGRNKVAEENREKNVKKPKSEIERDKTMKKKNQRKSWGDTLRSLLDVHVVHVEYENIENDERHLRCARLSMICLVASTRMLNIKRELFVRNSIFFFFCFTELPKKLKTKKKHI